MPRQSKVTQRANLLFERYVKHSYRYYQLDDAVISDQEFDAICRELLPIFDKVTHPDRHLTDEAALSCGTGYQMTYKWPEWAKERVY